MTESVEVVASAGETVNSTSGELARVIDQSQVQELALNGRNYMQLTSLIPGAPLLTDDALELATSLSVSQPINGNRGNTNNLTVDGGFGRQIWDISLRKRFALNEKIGLQFQGDFFNAWNLVNFNNPNVNTTDVAYGTINGAAPGRNLQFGLKLTF